MVLLGQGISRNVSAVKRSPNPMSRAATTKVLVSTAAGVTTLTKGDDVCLLSQTLAKKTATAPKNKAIISITKLLARINLRLLIP